VSQECQALFLGKQNCKRLENHPVIGGWSGLILLGVTKFYYSPVKINLALDRSLMAKLFYLQKKDEVVRH
jgi:hypothetical protein